MRSYDNTSSQSSERDEFIRLPPIYTLGLFHEANPTHDLVEVAQPDTAQSSPQGQWQSLASEVQSTSFEYFYPDAVRPDCTPVCNMSSSDDSSDNKMTWKQRAQASKQTIHRHFFHEPLSTL